MGHTFLAVFILASFLVLTGCIMNADLCLQKGKAHMGEQDYKAAVSDLSRAIAINSKAASKHYINARTHGPRYRQRFVSNEQGEGPRRYRNIDYDLEDMNTQGSEVLKAKKHNSDNAIAYFYRGTAKSCLKDKTGAISDFSSAITIDSTYSKAYCSRGVARIELGMKDSGFRDLCRAAEYGDTLALELISRYSEQK